MTQTTLIIARHGNTFGPDEVPRRVGARSDLDLVESGMIQGQKLGDHLRSINLVPDVLISGPLKRTLQMAEAAFPNKGYAIDARLREVDYGPDEGVTEDLVINRIGHDALKKWDDDAIVPKGWDVDPNQMTQDWQDIADETIKLRPNKITAVMTSNGVARFAPYITGDFEGFKKAFSLKLKTGAYGVLVHDGHVWRVTDWNVRPSS